MQPRKPNQSLSSYIFESLDEIEKMISLGYYQDSICRQLTVLGFTATQGGFKKALARARQKRRIEQGKTPLHIGHLESKTTTVKGNRLSLDEFALLERKSTTLPVSGQSPAKEALAKLAKFELTANEIAEITALADRISTRSAEGL